MKKIFATIGSFLIVFGLFFVQSVFAQDITYRDYGSNITLQPGTESTIVFSGTLRSLDQDIYNTQLRVQYKELDHALFQEPLTKPLLGTSVITLKKDKEYSFNYTISGLEADKKYNISIIDIARDLEIHNFSAATEKKVTTQSSVVQSEKVTGLEGKLVVVSGEGEKMFDITISQSSYNINNILGMTLEFTKVKEGESLPELRIISSKTLLDVPSPVLNKLDSLRVGEKKIETISQKIDEGEYILEFSDFQKENVKYGTKKITLTSLKSTEKPTGEVPKKPSNNTEGDGQGGNQNGDFVTGELLSPDAKLKNPFKALGSFEKIASAFLTGIVIPVGIPVLAIAIMYAGFLFVAARGNPTKLDDAKKAALWTAVGGFIMLGSLTIVRILQSTFDNISGSL